MDDVNREYGLVLAGGGTKGAYQVGCWKAIKKLNLNITAVVGASIGAINGALIVQDDYKLMEDLYNNIKISDILEIERKIDPNKNIFDAKNVFNIVAEYIEKKGIDNAPLRKMIIENIDVDKIYNSKMNFGIITYSVKERVGKMVFKDEIPKDEFVDYLLASSCFPIFKPQKIEDTEFLDGGLYDNVPINMLIKKGYKNILVLDVAGVGLRRRSISKDEFVKVINSKDIQGGVFEFNHDTIAHNIQLGYLDTLKAFNRLQGRDYYFKNSEFYKMLDDYNIKNALGLEAVADIYQIDKYKVYAYEEFKGLILKYHREAEEKYKKFKETEDFKKRIKEPKRIVELIKNGVGICFVMDLLAEQPELRIDRVATKTLKKYKEAAEAMYELLSREGDNR